MDFAISSRCVVAMETSDTDHLNMAKALATQAGMLCEDGSAEITFIGELNGRQLRSRIDSVRKMMARADLLLRAADALLDTPNRG